MIEKIFNDILYIFNECLKKYFNDRRNIFNDIENFLMIFYIFLMSVLMTEEIFLIITKKF